MRRSGAGWHGSRCTRSCSSATCSSPTHEAHAAAPLGGSGSYACNRGSSVVLLGRAAAPRYFCKCRPIADATLERETAVLGALNRDPELRAIVPQASRARDGEVQLQLNEFV